MLQIATCATTTLRMLIGLNVHHKTTLSQLYDILYETLCAECSVTGAHGSFFPILKRYCSSCVPQDRSRLLQQMNDELRVRFPSTRLHPNFAMWG